MPQPADARNKPMIDEFQNTFISYGRADSKAFVIQLYQRLTEQKLKVWFDQNDIPLAVDFQNQIDDGIQRSDNFVFVISPHAVNSPYCLKEIELALRLNKRIIPLLHVEQISRETWQQRRPHGTDAEWQDYQAQGLHDHFQNMHSTIRKINWVYFREGVDDYEASLAGLLSTLERHQTYVRQHTQLLIQALEWVQYQKQSRYLLIGEQRQQAETWLQERFGPDQPPCLPTDLHCEFITESIKNANNLMTQIFLAHAEEDNAAADQICRSLMREGFTVWTSKTDIQTGTDFQAAIDRGIEEADNLVYLLSPDALRSPYCRHEIDHALTLNKRIIPLLVRQTNPDAVPDFLRGLQYIDLTDNTTVAHHLHDESQLIRILRQDAAYYAEHKILLTKALKWQRQNRNPSILLRGYNLRHSEAWLKVAQQRPQSAPTPLQAEFIAESLRQPPGGSLDVFVSYSRTDSDFARRLNDALQAQGKRTWFDQESIASGTDFQQEINRGIATADHFLFILSPRSIQSPYCAEEVDYAQKLNKRIITVLHRPIATIDLHPALAAVQWIDFNQSDVDFSTHFSQLLRVLDTDRDHLQTHTRFLVRAIEWDNGGRKDSLLLRGDELEGAEQWLIQSQQKQPQPTDLHASYIHTSRAAEEASQRATQILQAAAAQGKQRVLIGTTVMAIGLVVASIAGTFAFWAHRAQKAAQEGTRLERAGNTALKQFEVQQLDGLLTAVRIGQQLSTLVQDRPLNTYPAFSPMLALQKILANIQEVNRLQLTQTKVLTVSFIANQLVTAAEDGTVRFWDADGQAKETFNLGRSLLWSISVSPDGQRIATIATNGILSLWTRPQPGQSWQVARSFPIGAKDFAEVSFSPDGQEIATLSQGLFRRWSLTGQRRGEIKTGGVSFSFRPDGKQIAICGGDGDGVVRLWNLTTPTLQKPERQFNAQSDGVFSLRFSPDGTRLATGGQNGIVRLWSAQGQLVDEFKTQQSIIVSLSFSRDGQQLAIADVDNTHSSVSQWRLSQPALPTLKTGQRYISGLQISPDGQQLLTVDGADLVRGWRLSGQPLSDLPVRQPDMPVPQQRVVGVSMSRDSKTVAIVTDMGTVQLYDRTGKPLTAFQSQSASSIEFSPTGQQLVTAGRQGAFLWNLTGAKQADIASGPVQKASFSADGARLLIAEGGKVIWYSLAGNPGTSLVAHEGAPILGMAVSPDGQHFATSSNDNTVRLWTIDNNLLAEHRFSQAVLSLSFSPDGKYLAAGDEAGSVRFIPVETLGSLLQRGCHWLRAYSSLKAEDLVHCQANGSS
jgi:WD40 repeat protein